MSYVVLARRYRPQKFQDLVGQEHVATTLLNAVAQNRLAHAFLFTGPRGVGKTSAARILAKAIRCQNPGPNREPCDKCESCLAILSGSSLDVLEIDAASNTGVDNIRDLRSTVQYTAVNGQYKIYIIDEVHMLSTAAFNALLKTLEEPPPNVIFIFATTELHKVLPTIVSRCQRFDFKKIPADKMRDCLLSICKQEGVEIDTLALQILIQESDGCLRDAESLLDQAMAFCGKKISGAELESHLGLMDRGAFLKLLEALRDRNSGAVLQSTRLLFARGVDPKILLQRLVEFYRELHFRKFAEVSSWTDPDYDPIFQACLNGFSNDEIIRAFDLCLKTQGSLHASLNAEYALESLCLKLSLTRPVFSQNAQSEAIQVSETYVPPTPVSNNNSASSKFSPPAAATPAPAPAPMAPTASSAREAFENYLRSKKPTWVPVLNSLLSMEDDGQCLIVKAKSDFAGRRLDSADGRELIKLATGKSQMQIHLEAVASPNAVATQNPAQVFAEKKRLAKEHDAVQSALKVFEGHITDTKILEDKRNGGK